MIMSVSYYKAAMIIIKINVLLEVRRENERVFRQIKDIKRKLMEPMNLFPFNFISTLEVATARILFDSLIQEMPLIL